MFCTYISDENRGQRLLDKDREESEIDIDKFESWRKCLMLRTLYYAARGLTRIPRATISANILAFSLRNSMFKLKIQKILVFFFHLFRLESHVLSCADVTLNSLENISSC